MDFEEWVDAYPVPPPVPRGERHVMSVSFGKEEYEAIQWIAHHPATRSMYGGQLTSVVRHGILPFLEAMRPLLDQGFRPVLEKIRDNVENANLMQTEKEILEMLDRKAKMFHLLLDYDQVRGALEEYDKFLDSVEILGPVWAPVVHKFTSMHSGMKSFRQRVQRLGEEELLALMSLEEKPR